jgi:biotin transporter BioY
MNVFVGPVIFPTFGWLAGFVAIFLAAGKLAKPLPPKPPDSPLRVIGAGLAMTAGILGAVGLGVAIMPSIRSL